MAQSFAVIATRIGAGIRGVCRATLGGTGRRSAIARPRRTVAAAVNAAGRGRDHHRPRYNRPEALGQGTARSGKVWGFRYTARKLLAFVQAEDHAGQDLYI